MPADRRPFAPGLLRQVTLCTAPSDRQRPTDDALAQRRDARNPTSWSLDNRGATIDSTIESIRTSRIKPPPAQQKAGTGVTLVVVVDTTCTFSNVMLTKTDWMKLLSLSKKRQVHVAIPEVVLQETARHWATKASELLNSIRGRIEKLTRAPEQFRDIGIAIDFTPPGQVPPVAVDQQEYCDKLHDRLVSLNVKFLPFPAVTAEEIFRRDLARMKPFSHTGKGYRDTLVWYSVLELLDTLSENDVAYLVTDNTSDYCDGDEIHPDLLGELDDSHPKLRHVRTLAALLAEPEFDAFVSELVADDSELLRYLQQVPSLDEGYFSGPSINETITQAIVSAADSLQGAEVETTNATSHGLDFVELPIPAEIESPSIDSIHCDESSTEWETYETYDDTTLLVRATIIADISVEGFAYKSDLSIIDDEVSILEWDWNGHMAHVSAHARGRLAFRLRVEVGVGVEDVEFEALEPI